MILKQKYRLDARLGEGGMGTVWRGRDLDLERDVAIKVLRTQPPDRASLERSMHEAGVAATLQHPGITVVHDIGQHNGRVFIVMELLTGMDLDAIVARNPRGLPVGSVLALGLQAAEALAVAHSRAMVHLDLKPANLFVLADSRLKICDFGIARAAYATSALTMPGHVMGTPAYMSPEQFTGGTIDGRCDLYSLGCVLYALLTGHPPFAGKEFSALMHQHTQVSPLPPRAGQACQGPLTELVLALLAKRPGNRPASAAAVAAALRNIQAIPRRLPPQPGAPFPPREAPSPRAASTRSAGRARRWLGIRAHSPGLT